MSLSTSQLTPKQCSCFVVSTSEYPKFLKTKMTWPQKEGKPPCVPLNNYKSILYFCSSSSDTPGKSICVTQRGLHLICTLDELVERQGVHVWVGKADAQALSRWTPLQSSNRVTGLGEIRGPEGSKTPQVCGIGCSGRRTTREQSWSLLLLHTRSQLTQGGR